MKIIRSKTKLVNEDIPLKFRRRLSFDEMKDDIDSLIYDFEDPCQYKTSGEYVAEICDSLKDHYISDFEFTKHDVTPKENDDLYYALVDLFGRYLSKIYYNECEDRRTPKFIDEKKVIRLSESELVKLIKNIYYKIK